MKKITMKKMSALLMSLMKLFGNVKGSNIQYIEDVRANAKGYEYLGKAFLAGNRKAVEAGVR